MIICDYDHTHDKRNKSKKQIWQFQQFLDLRLHSTIFGIQVEKNISGSTLSVDFGPWFWPRERRFWLQSKYISLFQDVGGSILNRRIRDYGPGCRREERVAIVVALMFGFKYRHPGDGSDWFRLLEMTYFAPFLLHVQLKISLTSYKTTTQNSSLGELAISRALGDLLLKNSGRREPKTTSCGCEKFQSPSWGLLSWQKVMICLSPDDVVADVLGAKTNSTFQRWFTNWTWISRWKAFASGPTDFRKPTGTNAIQY